MRLARLEEHLRLLAYAPKLPTTIEPSLLFYIGYFGPQFKCLVTEEELLALMKNISDLRRAVQLQWQQVFSPSGTCYGWAAQTQPALEDEQPSDYVYQRLEEAACKVQWHQEDYEDQSKVVQEAMRKADQRLENARKQHNKEMVELHEQQRRIQKSEKLLLDLEDSEQLEQQASEPQLSEEDASSPWTSQRNSAEKVEAVQEEEQPQPLGAAVMQPTEPSTPAQLPWGLAHLLQQMDQH